MNKLKEFRKKRGRTLEQLANESGACSKGYLCDVENGRCEPGVTKAIALARALKTTVEKIWGEK